MLELVAACRQWDVDTNSMDIPKLVVASRCHYCEQWHAAVNAVDIPHLVAASQRPGCSRRLDKTARSVLVDEIEMPVE